MVNYKRPRCGYNTENKPNIIRHLNRKHLCKPKLLNIDIIIFKKDIINGLNFIRCSKCDKIIAEDGEDRKSVV